MNDYRELREMEEKLMQEIANEKFLSLRQIIKVIELRNLYR